MTKNTNKPAPKSEEVISDEVLEKIEKSFKGMLHGTITLIIQDSRVIQLEKHEKIRLV
ncbi:YezD family protein [Anaerospora sp.]|uniref:YezD family protein n=1 Tax=Anaerospora sp. TaxID=1960278 RepID=UPI0028A03DA4|nr:YezD family protein [Anaerospora sp.]